MTKKRILFIEDEPDQVMMVTMRLEANNWEVMSAMDGEEGLKKVKEKKPDLILLDLVMPKLDGAQVCRRLKEDPTTKKIPIIVMTASGVKNLEKKCLALGAEDIIRKPYDSLDLVAKVKALLGELNENNAGC